MAPKGRRGRKRNRSSSSEVRPWDADLPQDATTEAEQTSAGNAFVDEPIEMHLLGHNMTGKHLCVLCHWASVAGLTAAAKHA
eukprot:6379803-Pyramimonas_sp.AAC.1